MVDETRCMKLIEGLKRLRMILKRITSNTAEITRYASKLSSEKSPFGSDDKQREEVASRVQSNQDLVTEYLRLKTRVDMTNHATMITIDGETRSLADWLLLKRQLGAYVTTTLMALNKGESDRRLRSATLGSGAERVVVEQLYDEAEKNAALRKWTDSLAEFDMRLEVVNATTDLVD